MRGAEMCEHQKQEVCGEQVCGVCFGEQLVQGRVQSYREGPRSEPFEKHPKGGPDWSGTLQPEQVKVYSVEERERIWRKAGHRVPELDERGAVAVFKESGS
jgi:hypothetical protein